MTEKSRQNNTPIIFGIVFAALSIIVMICSGSPFNMLHRLDGKDILPPLWLWCVTEIILKFLAGYVLGIVTSLLSTKRLCGDKEIKAYQGGIFFIAFIFLSLSHYPVFFIAEKPLAAILISALTLICSTICLIIWTKISFPACIIMILNTVWSAYVVFISARVLISL